MLPGTPGQAATPWDTWSASQRSSGCTGRMGDPLRTYTGPYIWGQGHSCARAGSIAHSALGPGVGMCLRQLVSCFQGWSVAPKPRGMPNTAAWAQPTRSSLPRALGTLAGNPGKKMFRRDLEWVLLVWNETQVQTQSPLPLPRPPRPGRALEESVHCSYPANIHQVGPGPGTALGDHVRQTRHSCLCTSAQRHNGLSLTGQAEQGAVQMGRKSGCSQTVSATEALEKEAGLLPA